MWPSKPEGSVRPVAASALARRERCAQPLALRETACAAATAATKTISFYV